MDYGETFSPAVKPTTIHTVLSLALSKAWPIHQLDVKNAFLHGELKDTMYMYQPLGYRDRDRPNHVCLLQKSLYGLKQALRAWYKCSKFAMKNLGLLSYFLGIAVTRHTTVLFLSQKKYAAEIIDRTGMSSCKPSPTRVDTKPKLRATTSTPFTDPSLYRSLAGALQYLTFTRPDITYAVQQVCLFMHDSRDEHMHTLKRIVRYLQGTLEYGLHLYPSSTTNLVSFTDADWGGCPDIRRLTSGYCVFMGDNLISWSAKRQATLSRSSAEAEYRGVANVVSESCCVIYLAGNPVQHQRTKHIEMDIHFIREKVARGQFRVLHVPSRYQIADIFTKGLPLVLFEDFWDSLSVRRPPALTTGVC
ncbi:uncharacterized mitochondrial protein AtMg00810-like [Solanum dulcamara]|uniref:uncharacterized mitochondrial protein AtMg00810-like n=1 Tax=Solanum dulcamara TaxID=45834 RepID=UPI002486889A|nr:uncharacterized mitochondrial protein AtMg00810-like [Solanum dulcamara]